MLKPIPQEIPELLHRMRRKDRHGYKNVHKKGPAVLIPFHLPKKMQEQTGNDKAALKKICLNFVEFIKNGERVSENEIADLSHSLQKAILCLQRRRRKLFLRTRTKLGKGNGS